MGTPAAWIAFNACVIALLVLDLGVFNGRAHEVSLRQAAALSLLWIALSLGFDAWIFHTGGAPAGLDFLTGYVVEQSLSLDNVLIFLLVFRAFAIEPRFQHRVLFWGLLGALALRGTMIGVGAALLVRFSWILYLFGAFLLIVGLRMFLRREKTVDPGRNRLLHWARRIFKVSENPEGERFFIRTQAGIAVTPLFLALIVIEGADLLFAMDSIPAVFGITRDPFLVYTSNICAILGMRAFYFLIGRALPSFRYLDTGLAALLIFIGAKMIAARWLHVPTSVSLIVVAAILALAIAASLLCGHKLKSDAG